MTEDQPLPEPTPIQRLAAIFDLLIESTAHESVRARVAIPLMIMMWSRIDSLARRFVSLFTRRQPRIPTPNPNRQTPTRQIRTSRPRPTRVPKISRPLEHCPPGGYGWLIENLPIRGTGIAVARAELEHLLTDPAMHQLIAATPALGRILRPLCYALGIERPPQLARPRPEIPHKRTKPRRRPEPYPRGPYADGILPRPTPFGPASRFWPPWLKPAKITA
ncbi:hypothetical protein AruPA_14695 [Acidiphilium sp. PA]|uniref:hypothetical protein n=1 Tax=Acidiphilium sp. PA TaxID=2871705 RepID=UPI00224459B1|nr:hypothetical protein [Acidiphilium sp. PA]MCW8308285.1 hypothetical protein [Acidiphilium sp. PA]